MKDGLPDTIEPVIPPAGWVTLAPDTYDRFHDGYVALAAALQEARAYVYNVANDHSRDTQPWRVETARGILGRIDAALGMESNLSDRTSA